MFYENYIKYSSHSQGTIPRNPDLLYTTDKYKMVDDFRFNGEKSTSIQYRRLFDKSNNFGRDFLGIRQASKGGGYPRLQSIERLFLLLPTKEVNEMKCMRKTPVDEWE